MSEAPASLLATRAHLLEQTGLPSDDIGIAADETHLSNGGYHCGAFDLRSINAVDRDDYSIRQPRDRAQYWHDLANGNNWASALDLGDDWPNGGRTAWIRFNNLLRSQLAIRDPALSCIRGINYTPDGISKRRFDCLTRAESSTTDSVTWHTHIEWWRDTNSAPQLRDNCTLRLATLAYSAITGAPLDGPPVQKIGNDMSFYKAPNGTIIMADGGVRVPVKDMTEFGQIMPAPVVISLPQALFDRFTTATAVPTPPPVVVDVDASQVAEAVVPAMVASADLRQMIRDEAFHASQDAETQ